MSLLNLSWMSERDSTRDQQGANIDVAWHCLQGDVGRGEKQEIIMK